MFYRMFYFACDRSLIASEVRARLQKQQQSQQHGVACGGDLGEDSLPIVT